MNAAASLVLLLAATTQAKDDSASQQAARGQHERVLAIYTNDAAEFTIYRDASRKDRVELRREPVLICSDPAGKAGTAKSSFGPAGAAPKLSAASFRSRRPGRAALPRVSFAVTVGAGRIALGYACCDLDARGTGHRDGGDPGRTSSRPIRPAAVVPDARADPRFLRLDQ